MCWTQGAAPSQRSQPQHMLDSRQVRPPWDVSDRVCLDRSAWHASLTTVPGLGIQQFISIHLFPRNKNDSNYIIPASVLWIPHQISMKGLLALFPVSMGVFVSIWNRARCKLVDEHCRKVKTWERRGERINHLLFCHPSPDNGAECVFHSLDRWEHEVWPSQESPTRIPGDEWFWLVLVVSWAGLVWYGLESWRCPIGIALSAAVWVCGSSCRTRWSGLEMAEEWRRWRHSNLARPILRPEGFCSCLDPGVHISRSETPRKALRSPQAPPRENRRILPRPAFPPREEDLVRKQVHLLRAPRVVPTRGHQYICDRDQLSSDFCHCCRSSRSSRSSRCAHSPP